MKKHYSPKNGQVMIMGIVVLVVVLILAASLFGRTSTFISFGAKSVLNEQATQVAEAGIDYAVQKLNDTAGAYTGSNQTLSVGTAAIQVATKSQNLKTVTVTGYIPNAAAPRSKRTVKVDVYVSTQQISFYYAVQTGDGGVSMAQSSTVNGTIYTNGSITKGAGNQQTIDGDAYAVGTIDSGIVVRGNKYCQTGCSDGQPSPRPLPTVEETDWLETADANPYPFPCPCNIASDTTLLATRFNGDLTISNNAVVTLTGPVHITGNFNMTQGGTTLKPHNSFGSNGTAVIVDGTVDLSQGGIFQTTSATPPGYILIISHSNLSDAVVITQSGSTAVFYALSGGAILSQTARVSSLTANQLSLSQSATLDYDTGLASASFANGTGASWQIKKGTYRQTSSP